MGKDFVIGEDVEITLTVIYVFGFIASLWMVLMSPVLLDWLGAKLYKHPKNKINWGKVFLIIALLQPVTFFVSAVGLWWVGVFAFLPPIHFVLTIFTMFAIDFFRDEEPWEREHERRLNEWQLEW